MYGKWEKINQKDKLKFVPLIYLTKKVFKLLNNGESIAKICNISVDRVKEIIE